MQHDNRSVMVCLISRQTMQNLLPILQYRPQQVVCITTREEDDSRKHLEAVLHTRQFPTELRLSTWMRMPPTLPSRRAVSS